MHIPHIKMLDPHDTLLVIGIAPLSERVKLLVKL
jgi:hypothetical protein